mmetsp:Transcript_24176/g.59740  ORF Transcript_24176/g.59740 Transcript_24176/m.59740 type:complete len:84 (+) Transcript_24176:3-254(+)
MTSLDGYTAPLLSALSLTSPTGELRPADFADSTAAEDTQVQVQVPPPTQTETQPPAAAVMQPTQQMPLFRSRHVAVNVSAHTQ